MRILWVHNFDPAITANGVFMHILADQMRSAGVDLHLHFTGNLRSIHGMIRAVRQLRGVAKQYDLLHAQFGSACGLVTSFAEGPKILSLRGTDLLGTDCGMLWHRAHGLICRYFTCTSLHAYEKIVVMSHRMGRELKNIYAGADIEVVPDGIDLHAFQPMDRMEARRKLGQEGNEAPWILFSSISGPGTPGKRLWLASAAFDLIRKQYPNAELKFLTGQPHDRVSQYINACNAVLLTSTREGWPNIIKEAIACNVPFVSTDVSDLRSIADQEPSCHVTEAKPETLADALLHTLRFGRPTSLRRHAEPMELAATGRRLAQIYEGLLQHA